MAFRRRAHFHLFRARILQVALVTAGIVLGVRLIWGWEASLRLASVRSQIPLLPFPDDSDASASATLADPHNAAAVLMQAVRALHLDENDMPSHGDGRPMYYGRGWGFRSESGRLRPMLQDNAAAIQLVDKATHLNEIHWPATASTVEDPASTPSGPVNAFPLRIVLTSAAEVAHENNDEPGTLEALRRLLGVAHILDLAPDINSHVVAAGMRSEVANLLERWDLHPQATAPAKAFLDVLVNEQSTTGIMISRSFDYETSAYEHWATQALPGLGGWWLRPLALDGFARRLTLQQQIAPITQAHNWPQVLAIRLPTTPSRSNLNMAVLALSEPRLDIVDVMRMHFRAQCDSRAAAILLAANLYHADHQAYPTTLSQLVPTYIDIAPIDPFNGHDQPLHYRLDAHGPTVWSVGDNGTDEGGAMPVFGGVAGGGGGGSGPRGGAPSSHHGMGYMGYGFGRRYSQPDVVYGAAYRDALLAARGF